MTGYSCKTYLCSILVQWSEDKITNDLLLKRSDDSVNKGHSFLQSSLMQQKLKCYTTQKAAGGVNVF